MFSRKKDFEPFENKVWLASPTMHDGAEMKYVKEAYDTNWMSTVGANINEVEKVAAEKSGVKYAVALSCCTAAHGALLIEDAAEAMGATWDGKQCGSYGDYAAVSYNGNKIITGSSGGCLLTNDLEVANKARKWSTQAREAAAWYQHEEVGYNYRMSNVIAGIIRGQYNYLEEHIAQKKVVYERYKEGLKDLPIQMNPFDEKRCEPNYWLSALIIDKDAMCKQVRSGTEAIYIPEKGKSCPTEILEAISSINAEGRPIWKPMHMQPMYRMNEFVTVSGSGRAKTNAYIEGGIEDVGADIFQRGVCLPSDNKMTAEQQDRIIEVIRACFE